MFTSLFFSVLYSSSLLPSEGPYPNQGPMSYLGQVHPSQLLRRRLSVTLIMQWLQCWLFVVLHSRIYDVTHRHRTDLFRLRSLSRNGDLVKSALFFVQLFLLFLRVFSRIQVARFIATGAKNSLLLNQTQIARFECGCSPDCASRPRHCDQLSDRNFCPKLELFQSDFRHSTSVDCFSYKGGSHIFYIKRSSLISEHCKVDKSKVRNPNEIIRISYSV